MASTTTEGNKKADEDFKSGFDEEITKPEQTDDEAFGLTPDEAPDTETPTGDAPAVAIVIDPAKDEGEAPVAGEEAAPAEGGEEAAAAEAEPPLDIEKEKQRLKSWEGRLRAKEAELAARQVEEATETTGEEAQEEVTGEEGGEGDADVKALEEDFGPEFVKLLTSFTTRIARQVAADTTAEHAAPFRQDIDAIISEITNDKQRVHFERISDAHPDFMDIAESDGFKAWIGTQAPEDKAETDRIVASGTASEIISLLNKYKADIKSGDDMSDALDDAEGVRSTGLRLPETPAGKGDFESAWNEA